MPRPQVEFAVPLAAAGVLLAIGVPAWQRGHAWVGGACVAAALLVAGKIAWTWWRSRP
jgi:hypothetical protein